ncbi:sensor histidine kinase KdpD [Haladaptatus sp. YSMS36]|uniref:sensor histidine kinase n=1 Tax=Haladaptatus sp. YSMS36 TaxID=3033384 RepID=UPI0023E8C12E|nr:HAMP domain-containing sensor histidine kinase [Haladaptatus sp. YSMS36]
MSQSPEENFSPSSYVPRAIMTLGLLLYLSMLIDITVFGGLSLEWALSREFIAHIATTSPFILGIIFGGYWLDRSPLSPTRYTRIAKWTFGGLLAFLGLNVIVMVAIPPFGGLEGYVGWGRFAAAVGAGGGLLLGVVEARAITRERAAERAVVRAEELEYRTDQLEFFNSILRHDVLNGMTVVQGRASHLLASSNDEESRRHLKTIVQWSDDIVNVVQRVRAIIRILSNESEVPLAATNLTQAVNDEVRRLRTTYPEVTFKTNIPDGVYVKADDLLGEIIGNVLTNAVNHNSREGLRVTVQVGEIPARDVVELQIADTGTGIPDDQKHTVFRRGEKGHAKDTGDGFGLFFVDAMVGAYGGNIRVEDNQPQGANFVIELPIARSDSPVANAGQTLTM